jgi:hypothetical protein
VVPLSIKELQPPDGADGRKLAGRRGRVKRKPHGLSLESLARVSTIVRNVATAWVVLTEHETPTTQWVVGVIAWMFRVLSGS